MGTKTKYTAGPWTLNIEKTEAGIWHYKIVTEDKPLGAFPVHIATLNKFKDEAHLANAALISAAPEMLEILELYLAMGVDCGVIEKMKNVVNKAKGGQNNADKK